MILTAENELAGLSFGSTEPIGCLYRIGVYWPGELRCCSCPTVHRSPTRQTRSLCEDVRIGIDATVRRSAIVLHLECGNSYRSRPFAFVERGKFQIAGVMSAADLSFTRQSRQLLSVNVPFDGKVVPVLTASSELARRSFRIDKSEVCRT